MIKYIKPINTSFRTEFFLSLKDLKHGRIISLNFLESDESDQGSNDAASGDDYNDSNESSYCSIVDSCTREDIINGYIRINKIEKLIAPQILSDDIKLLISLFYRNLPYFNATIINEEQKRQLIKLLLQNGLFNSTQNVKFELLFDAKSNDYSAAKFHEICDNIADILVIFENTKGSIYGYFSRHPFIKSKPDPSWMGVDGFILFRLKSNVEQYPTANSHYRDISKTEPEVIINMNTPKVFNGDRSYSPGMIRYNEKEVPSTFIYPTLKIADKCNVKDSNLCHHNYEYRHLGIEICGTMEEVNTVNCLHAWSFTIENYQRHQQLDQK